MKEFTNRLTIVETKLDRVIEDIETHRSQAAHRSSELNGRIESIDIAQRKTDKIIYMGLGGLGLLQFVLQALH